MMKTRNRVLECSKQYPLALLSVSTLQSYVAIFVAVRDAPTSASFSEFFRALRTTDGSDDGNDGSFDNLPRPGLTTGPSVNNPYESVL